MGLRSRSEQQAEWLALAYAGDVTGTFGRARPLLAARMLAEDPGLAAGDAFVACAIGDEAVLRATIAADPGWVNRPGGALALLPLVAVAHSHMLLVAAFAEKLRRCAALLLPSA